MILLLGAAFAAEPLADVAVSGSVDTEARWWMNDLVLEGFEDRPFLLDYGEQVARVTLLASAPKWSAGVQADEVWLPSSRYYLDEVLVYEWALHGQGVEFPVKHAFANLEKVYVSSGPLTAGDYYMSLGRGMSLNMVRNTDIDIDTTLRGARLDQMLGSNWKVMAFSGIANQQQVLQDNPNRQVRADRRHVVSGARVDRYALGPANLGAHAAAVSFARDVEEVGLVNRYRAPVDAVIAGANVELFGVLGGDWYLEGDAFNYRTSELFNGEEPSMGHAVYGSASFYPGRFAILVEAKDNQDTERVNTFTAPEGYELSSGPTLEYERVITEDSSAAVNSNDVTSGRVRVDASVNPGVLVAYGAMMVARDRELGGLHFNAAPETIFHPMVGVDWQGPHSHLILNTGFRVDDRDGADLGQDRLAHADISYGFPMGPLHGEIAGDLQVYQWGVNPQQQENFEQTALAFSAHSEKGFTLVLYNDYSNNPLLDSVGNLAEHLYGAAELQYQPTPSSTLKLFYGAYRAGIRCAGGQCRQLPGFEGARVAFNATF